jgi:predicted ATPase
VLAQHYTAAGAALQAIPYWLKAGQAALQRSTLAEATGHLTRGLELIPTLSNEKILAGLELELQATLAIALSGSKGFAVPEVEHAYIRARTLCDQIGSIPQLFPVLWGLFLFHWVRGHLEQARANADEMLSIAEQADDAALLLIAHFSLGGVLYHIGQFRTALYHLLQAQARYDEKAHAPLAMSYGQDFGVWTLSYLGQVQLSLGYPEKAARTIGEALALGRRLNQPLSLCNAFTFNALTSVHRRDPASANKFSEELRRLADGFPQYQAIAALNGGWALAQLGSLNEGVELGQQGNIAWHALGANVSLPINLTVHAESQVAAGQTRAALESADQALSWIGTNGEHAHECYVHCCRGDKFRELDEPENASHEYEIAIAVARKQEAKFWELRAAMSMARLWRDQGKRDEARELLAPVYGWFTEGFDTRDLKEAKALLDELAA